MLIRCKDLSCNLKCTGCYANSEPETGHPEAQLPWDMLDRIMAEAEERWGVALFVFSGGEPLINRSHGKDLLDPVEKHKDCLFLSSPMGHHSRAKPRGG